jgi:alpha-L-glutamate ligase-like protein
MSLASQILGLNARNHLYSSRYNSKRGKRIAKSKLLTKRFLKEHGFPHPELYGVFRQFSDVPRFDWGSLRKNFVIKPSKGYGGDGILIVKRRLGTERFLTIENQEVLLDDLKLHVLDILEGNYSKYDTPDIAFIEERVPKHPKFKRYAYRGTPDIRILVFNQVPVMAMLRLPTPQSKGKANLHQGGLCVGVDLATGITTFGMIYDRPVQTVPETSLKVNGLRIPHWDEMLEIALAVQQEVKLGYLAVDFVLHKEKGPMVLELTSSSGLGIQIANRAGLRKRLERVEGLERVGEGRGIRIARALFAESFADKVLAERGAKIVEIYETAKVKDSRGKRVEVEAKIDTGAFRTSIDKKVAEDLGLLEKKDILWEKNYISALGRERRPIIELTFWLKGRRVKTAANVSNRKRFREKLLVGRRDLKTFLVRTE